MFEYDHGTNLVLYQMDSSIKADHAVAGLEVDEVEKVVNNLLKNESYLKRMK